jgi:hypothetical protein
VGLGLSRAIQLVRRRVLFWDPSEKASPERGDEDAPVPQSLGRDPRTRKKEVAAW